MIKSDKLPGKPKSKDAGLRHPMFGCMKGMIEISDGCDMTTPMFEDWEVDEMANRLADQLAEASPELVVSKLTKGAQK